MSQLPPLPLSSKALPERGEALAVAVSGGADSFSLLHRLWADGWPIIALTVDHGMRPESADEAKVVSAWCAMRGIPHEILRWADEKPLSGKLEAARNARYRLLCEACNRLGIEWLLTAHTADDQAETVFMRLRRGSGRGLAAMPLTRKIAGGAGTPVTLGRPMLSLRRADVRAYADGHDLPIQDDPSNDDPAYERIRIRALLAALEQQDLLSVEALCRTAEDVLALNRKEDELLCRTYSNMSDTSAMVKWSQDYGIGWDKGYVCLSEFEFWSGHGPEYAGRVASAVGATHSAVDWIDLEQRPGVSQTVCGALICVSESSDKILLTDDLRIRTEPRPVLLVWILREPAALLGRADGAPGFTPIKVSPSEKHLYDGRFIVTIPDDIAPGTALRPLGQMIPRDIATSTLARQRIATLPCLAMDHEITHIPERARHVIFAALDGWKALPEHLLPSVKDFPTESLLAERFSGDVIRY